jgi:hypothetical protein
MLAGKQRLREELAVLYGNVNRYEGRPTRSQLDRMAALEAELEEAEASWQVLRTRIAELNRELESRGHPPVELVDPDETSQSGETGRG